MNFRALAAAIRELRHAKGWSMTELSRQAKLSTSTVYRIERGELAPTLTTVVMLAKTLGVSASELVARGGL